MGENQLKEENAQPISRELQLERSNWIVFEEPTKGSQGKVWCMQAILKPCQKILCRRGDFHLWLSKEISKTYPPTKQLQTGIRLTKTTILRLWKSTKCKRQSEKCSYTLHNTLQTDEFWITILKFVNVLTWGCVKSLTYHYTRKIQVWSLGSQAYKWK